MRLNVALYGSQPGCAYAAPLCDRCAIARCPERNRDQIAKLCGDQLPRLRYRQRGIVQQRARVMRQERKRAGTARDRLKKGIVDVAHERGEGCAGQSEDAVVYRPWSGNRPRLGIAEEHGVTIPQDDLAAATHHGAEAAEVQMKAEVGVVVLSRVAM